MDNALLWQISPPDGAYRSWLFGTMHTRDAVAHRLGDRVEPLIRACDVFALEFDLAERAHISISDQFYLPNEQELPDLMRSRKYDKLRRIVEKSVGIDLDQFRRVRPFFVQSIITEAILQHEFAVSLDERLYRFAREHNIPVLGIESYADQVTLLGRISIEDQVRQLLQIGKNIGKFRANLLDLRARYAAQDIHGLYQRTKKSSGKLRRLLLHDRNEKMAVRILDIGSRQQAFVAVGAAHLSGRYGILALLRRWGWHLESHRFQSDAPPLHS